MMKADNPVMLRVVVGFLKGGRVLDGASSVLLLGTLVRAMLPATPLLVVGLGVALVLAGLEKYFAWRVALDAEFFALLHEQPEQAENFDAALAAFLSRSTLPAHRSFASRWHGTRQLVISQAVTLLLQALMVSALCLFFS
ncbi:MAG: hypothetical protein EOO59_12760 [Hymenobacter sp.]|nr:MAG: hypothetical protein EOO59_12760 [Hymenobacter sp.]